MRLIRIGTFVIAAWIAVDTHGADTSGPTSWEVEQLPPFCKVRFDSPNTSPEYRLWEEKLGHDFVHTHHYCSGLYVLNRYYRSRSPQDKSYNLSVAIAQFTYVVRAASPTYILMPDVYLNRGVALFFMKRNSEALADLTKSIELNPRMVQAYNRISAIYEGNKDRSKALEIVTDGLRHNPNSKSLQHRFQELGGKLPYPAPIQPSSAEDRTRASAMPIETGPKSEVDAIVPADPSYPPGGPAAKPKTGASKSPNCRFCPD